MQYYPLKNRSLTLADFVGSPLKHKRYEYSASNPSTILSYTSEVG